MLNPETKLIQVESLMTSWILNFEPLIKGFDTLVAQ